MLEIRYAHTNAEFLAWFGPVLDRYDERTQLFRINLRDPEHVVEEKECRGAVYDGEEPVLLFLNANPFSLQLFALRECKGAISLLARDLAERHTELKGLLSSQGGVGQFLTEYQSYVACKSHEKLSMDIMKLETLIPLPNKGTILVLDKSFVDQIIEMKKLFSEEALHEALAENVREATESQLEKGMIYGLFDQERRLVSIAMTSRRMKYGASLNLVFTPKEHRNQGYSGALLTKICEDLFDAGNHYVSLFVDKKNPVSNHLYLKLGFRVVADAYEVLISK